jgi:hypothetical protein
MKQLLIDVKEFPLKFKSLSLNENINTTSGNPIVTGPLATAEQKNGNGRYYSKELWDRELNKYLELVKSRRAMGELDHPESQVINLKNVSHIVTNFWWEGNDVIGDIEILPTPSGNTLKSLIESKITVGVSSRGMGSLEEKQGVLEVQDDFELLCWDFVSNPSNQNSLMELKENINESIQHNKNQYKDINNIIYEILCSKGSCPIT